MAYPSILDDILIFLLTAIGVAFICRRIRISPVIGYLIAGIMIGPNGVGFIDDFEETKILGEFGVLFLMFTIGLELPIQRLQILRRYVFGLGALQVILTTASIGIVSHFLGLSFNASLLIGVSLALSSTAVVLQILSERGELPTRFGRVAFSILLFQDLAVIIVLVCLSLLTIDSESLMSSLGFAFIKASFVLGAIILGGQVILRPVYRGVAAMNSPELFMATTFLIVLATSMATSAAGLSMTLGAFLAGLLLAETEYRHQIEVDIEPFRGLLLGLFFVTVGMAIDMSILVYNSFPILMIVGGMVLGKSLITAALCRFFEVSLGSALRVGLLLATGGEFVFVLLGSQITGDMIDDSLRSTLFAAVALSMAVTPFLASLGKMWARYLETDGGAPQLQAHDEEVRDLENHVIIVGFGRVGKLIAELLQQRHIPYVAIDLRMTTVTEGRAMGFNVFFGDARRAEIIGQLGANKASVCVISLDHMPTSLRAVTALRRAFPYLKICARVRNTEHQYKLKELGAIIMEPETVEPSIQLGALVLEALHTPPEEIRHAIEIFRKSYTQTIE